MNTIKKQLPCGCQIVCGIACETIYLVWPNMHHFIQASFPSCIPRYQNGIILATAIQYTLVDVPVYVIESGSKASALEYSAFQLAQ